MSESESEKTLAPSKRRRQEARREGLLARSRDLQAGLFLLVVAGLLQYGSETFLETSKQFLAVSLESVVGNTSNDSGQTADESVSFLGRSAGYYLLRLWPVWILPLVAAGMMLLQIGPFFQPHLAQPDFARFANGWGLSRLWSGDAWLRLFSGTIKLLILSSIAWFWTSRSLTLKLESELPSAYEHGCAQAAGFLGALALGLIGWGAIDYFIQWFRLERNLRMSPEEQRHEQQELEPDPRMRQEMISLATRTTKPVNSLSVNDLLLSDGLTRCLVLRFDPQRDELPRIVLHAENQAGVLLLQQAMRLQMAIREEKSIVNDLFLQPAGSLIVPSSHETHLARMFAEVRSTAQDIRSGEIPSGQLRSVRNVTQETS
jgi:flagellar biosynthesis protein FlhB